MSAPIDPATVGRFGAVQSALCELLSAESSLHMYTDPIAIAPDSAEPAYLSACDANARHAIEHLHAAFRLINAAYSDMESLKTQVYRLAVQLRELGATPKIKTWLDEE